MDNQLTSPRITGFEPYQNADSEILILGSFPSVKSREQLFYYGNKQNRFWQTLAAAYGEEVPLTLDRKKSLLNRHKIALYDVVASCVIKGSMDSDIKDYRLADIDKVMSRSPIKKILLNGGVCTRLFYKGFPSLADVAVPLPSTSPANVSFNNKLWLDALKN